MDAKQSFVSRFAEFEKRSGSGDRWLQNLRREAIARFDELGFPTTADEEWKYTSVDPIARSEFSPASPKVDGWTPARVGEVSYEELACIQLVFLNGVYSSEMSSTANLPKGVKVSSLAGALRSETELVRSHLARYAGYRENAFTALNTAYASDGSFVYLPDGTDLKHPIHLLFLATDSGVATVSHPRNLIVAGAAVRASLIETYVGPPGATYFTNSVTEISAGKDSLIEHNKLQRESEGAFHIASLQVKQERGSRFSSHSISLGGSLVRNDVRVLLDAEGGECALNGLYMTRGRQHVDNHTTIDHASPHCSSRELYKGILDGRSTGVFNGRILVRKDAQKTSAHQTNRNLLLSEDALVNTKPQLEILADDVKCTHGATVGQLDADALFYMRSRGIGESAARSLLTYAFASEIVGRIRIQPVQCQLDLLLLRNLHRGPDA